MALTEVPPSMNDGRRDTAAAPRRIAGAAGEPGHDHTVLTDADCARIAAVLNASVGPPVRRLSARLLSGGRSNLTYALSDGKRSWVLRRPLADLGLFYLKICVPSVAQEIIDRSIQIHGAAGLTGDFPLAMLFAQARGLRFADGPEEVHRAVLAKRELKRYSKTPVQSHATGAAS